LVEEPCVALLLLEPVTVGCAVEGFEPLTDSPFAVEPAADELIPDAEPAAAPAVPCAAPVARDAADSPTPAVERPATLASAAA
jgi:hypothetical protein